MGTLNQMKMQAFSFIHEKYNDARLLFTDVSEAELLAEQATNNDPCSPDAKTMTSIAEASYDVDEYWRIVDVIRRRLYETDWKNWRQSYKALVLIEFLLTHGPEEFAQEFDADAEIIQELGSFKHRDERGIDWGQNMQKRSERILELSQGGEILIEARWKALKITNEIQGFGNLTISPSATSSPSASSSVGLDSATSSSSAASSSACSELSPSCEEATTKHSCGGIKKNLTTAKNYNENADESHLWNCPPIEETGFLMDVEDAEHEKPASFMGGICAKLGISPRGNGKNIAFKSVPQDVDTREKKINRQFSLG